MVLWLALPSPKEDRDFELIRLPLRKGGWNWDGNAEKPTVTPSIHTHGVWHGFVRAGELVEATQDN
jgi:hypothetical protein